MFSEILPIILAFQIINKENSNGETPLFSAITSGVTACIELLVYYHASIDMKLPGNITVLHRAAEYGHHDILRYLLEEDRKRGFNLIDQHDALRTSGMTPLHMAAFNNHPKCVRELLQMNCSPEQRTAKEPYGYSKAIHLAARKGYHEVIGEIAGFSSGAVSEQDGNGWNALQIAAYYGHREAVKVLVRVGADLVRPKHGEHGSPLHMIMKNVPRPTELLESVFDECITSGDEFPITNTECQIVIDYSALIPMGHGSEQMLVLKELLKSRNRHRERKLLLHPVVESFLHKKWRALGPFFYVIILLYTIFVCSLTLYAMSIYFRKDYSDVARSCLVLLLFVSILMIAVGEVLYGIKNFRKYVREIETWVKLGSFFLALLVVTSDHTRAPPNDWPRHITALSILLAWTELMFLLSRFPNWGYYVQMFFKVTGNVIKVLLTFLFLVIGFALSFMLEFQGDEPFSTPVKSLVKTVVMMASEFDYGSLFEGKSDEKFQLVFLIGNVLFVIFLVLASIVLMNLMVGLAVSDIQDLEIQGKIDRLVKQVDFLSALDSDNVIDLLPAKIMKRLKQIKNVEPTMVIYPGRPRRSQRIDLPSGIYNSIIELALKQGASDEGDVKTSTEELSARMDELNVKIESVLQILEDIKRKQN